MRAGGDGVAKSNFSRTGSFSPANRMISMNPYPMAERPTYSPSPSDGTDDATGDHHRLHASGTLEQHSANNSSNNTIRGVMLSARVTNHRIDAVVHHSNHARGVAKERASSGDRVQNTVETQLWRRGDRSLFKSFHQTPCTSNRQRSEIGSSRSIAQIIRPASRW